MFSQDGTLKVADVGSTNGTFLDGKRITYGKAYQIIDSTAVAFGDVKVRFDWEMPQPEIATEPETIEDSVLNKSADANGAIKIGVASMKPNAPAEISEKSSNELAKAETDNQKMPDDEDEITILDRHRAAPKTFLDPELAGDRAPQTFIDPDLRDSQKTFVDEELREQPSANQSETSKTWNGEQPSDAPKTFIDAELKNDGVKDFTQSLPRLDGDAADFGQTAGNLASNRQNAEKTKE